MKPGIISRHADGVIRSPNQSGLDKKGEIMGTRRWLFSITVLGLGLVLCNFTLAIGQESDMFTLEEIIVTAQKRTENSQEVPIALSNIEGKELMETGATTLKDSLNKLASVTIMQVNEGVNVSIRGMDNDGMPGDSAGMIAINLDGVFSNNFATGYSGLYDVSRVEVLVGPQGTLYSRNSGGGVVNMITNDPKPDAFDANGSIEIGNYNTLNTQGAVNVPVDERSALRLAFATTDRDGYIDNGSDDNDSKSVRLKYLLNVTDDLSTVFTYENIRTGGKGQGREGVAPFADEDDTDDPWASDFEGKYYYDDKDSKKISMNLTWNTAIGSVTFLPSYTKLDRLFGTPQENMMTGEVGQLNCIDKEEETSGELRMNSNEDSFVTWVAGLYYYKKKWNDDAESPSDLNYNRLNNPTQAVFGNITYPVTDRFRVTGGGRYTEDHERMEFRITDVETLEDRMYENWDVKNDHFDYKLGLEYDVSPNSMIWLENSTGYRQGYRGSESQTLDSYQIGSKNRFLDNRIQANAAAFYYDYTDYQVQSMDVYVDPSTGEVLDDIGVGTGDATLYGFDIDTEYLLTQNDRFSLSASYLHSEIKDLTIEYLYLPPQSQYNDSPLNDSPEWTVTGGYKHEFYLVNGGNLTAGVDFRYRTEYFCSFSDFISDPDSAINTQPDQLITNASLNYAPSSGKWNINAYVKNIENHAEKVGLMRGTLRLSAPRTFGAVLSVKY